MPSSPVEYRLVRPDTAAAPAPQLDESQQAVVDHRGGPLLVLAGPGTGKTTTIVEVVVDRIAREELRPEQILVLTFSRKAAEELRERIAARLAGSAGVVPAMTFHAFCYALVREFSDPEAFAAPPTLLTAPERDAVIAELLAGHDVESWPASLRQALRTRGFAGEVQSFMAQLAARGLDAADLRELAAARQRPDWARLADAIEEYDQVTGLQNLADYTNLVTSARQLIDDPRIGAQLRERFGLVVVDEYQDTDPLQVDLLHELAGDGRDLVVVGDHDQAIYGFRGADPAGIAQFPEQFGTPAAPARVLALRVTRRFGPEILRAAHTVLGPVGHQGSLDPEILRRHREVSSRAPYPGEVRVETYASATAEAEHIADLLRRAHLDQQLPWSDMAVLVRTGSDLARLQRALVPAGVPVEVAGDEIPLTAEPAVRALLSALEAADLLARGFPLDPEHAQVVLSGPLGELDAPALRRLGRALRQRAPERRSTELTADALSDPAMLGFGRLEPATAEAVERARRLAALLRRAAKQISDGEPPEQALWTLWDGTDWPQRLLTQWESGGEGRLTADRDLDAVVALFHHAARTEERKQRVSVANFIAELRAQQIPADQLVGSQSRPDAVRLMTAHRSKGLEWPLVVVAGVQEERWPDLRHRGSLLQAEALDGAHAASRSDRLREERRLFYVACTRASRTLVVTAVETPTDDGDQPSRFVRALLDAGFGPADPGVLPRARPRRPLSLRGVVAQLRSYAGHPDVALRDEAAAMLAEIARHDVWAGRAAHPDRWWGTRELTINEHPLKDPDAPIVLSGSSVAEIASCSLKWFLSREARGTRGSSTAQGFGLVVHAIAADIVRRDVREPDLAEMEGHLDEVWDRLDHQAPWISAREKADARTALLRFARWHAANPRTPLAAEHAFEVELELDGERAVLKGSMDRVELDAEGRVHVVDFKTSKNAPKAAEVAAHPQLGVYQLAVAHGATEELAPGAPSGGAELVQLRQPAGAKHPDVPKVQPQDAPAAAEPFFALDLVRDSIRVMREERFVAMPDTCSFCEFQMVCPSTTAFTIGGGEQA
ncbi:ATP-dependent helicase [Aeromicrobium phragmitis]|nr:ATP-dependent DNA helicase [Aeromicrobium phragmitis]